TWFAAEPLISSETILRQSAQLATCASMAVAESCVRRRSIQSRTIFPSGQTISQSTRLKANFYANITPTGCSLTVSSPPIVGDHIVPVGVQPVLVGGRVVVGLGDEVQDHRLVLADALPAMIGQPRHHDELHVVRADEELIDELVRRRVRSVVEDDQLD